MVIYGCDVSAMYEYEILLNQIMSRNEVINVGRIELIISNGGEDRCVIPLSLDTAVVRVGSSSCQFCLKKTILLKISLI